MRKIKNIFRNLMFCLLLTGSSLVAATVIIPPYPGEKYDPEIFLPDLETQMGNYAYLTALETIWSATGELGGDIISGDVLFFVEDWVNRPGNADWLAKQAYEVWQEEIDLVFQNQFTTDDEKAAQILGLIDQDISSYEVSTTDSLNLTAKHATNFRSYKLLWDRKQYTKRCVSYGFYLEGRICQSSACYDQFWNQYVGYGRFYYTYEYGITSYEKFYYEPDYEVYRTVDGEDKLITTIQGYKQGIDWLSIDDVWDELTGSGIEVPDNGLVLFDFDSDLVRGEDTSLSYKIVSSTQKHKPWCVNSASTLTSVLDVDSDKDGDPDFVPWHVLHEDAMVTLVIINTLLM